MRVYAFVCACLLVLSACNAFYLPGISPRQFTKGESIHLKVKELDSIQTQLPKEYYSLPFPRPKEIKHFAENLGEELTGERIENSLFDIRMGEPKECVFLGTTPTDTGDAVSVFSDHIKKQYRVQWIIDNLPASRKFHLRRMDSKGREIVETKQSDVVYERGFPLGFVADADTELTKKGHVYLNNHVVITLLYHSEKDLYEGSRIVGFEVVPFSVRHVRKDGEIITCPLAQKSPGPLSLTDTSDMKEIVWTYDVKFEHSPIKWAVRWDVYSQMTDVNVHWFSLINSLMIVIFLTGMVAMIMARTLHRDFRRYNELEQDDEAQQEETGWKLVHGDVFRPPQHGGLFSVLVGSGVQILLMSLLTLFFAVLGFLSPANRGGLMTALVLLFVFMGIFAGYYSTRIYKMFGLLEWRKNTLHTAIGFPGTAFAMFFVLNLLVWSHHSSGAVPFGAMFALLVLWFGISVPLVYLGSYIGYKKPAISVPVKVNQIPRQVPEQAWYMIPYFSVLVGGLLPFGAVFIEVFFIMGSIWKHQFYYLFGFLSLVFFILVLTCAEITIVMCYFQLCSEDYNWWWRSFFTSGASALYLFAYSILYYSTSLHTTGIAATLLYFGYMLLISVAFFLATGTIGFIATLAFVKKIYGSIKVD